MKRHWRALSTHAHILAILHLRPRITMREVAVAVGITERRVAANIANLQAEGLVRVIKRGPRNTYHVRKSARLPPSAHGPKTAGEFLDSVVPLVEKMGSMPALRKPAARRPSRRRPRRKAPAGSSRLPSGGDPPQLMIFHC